jgi:hypothetical protein
MGNIQTRLPINQWRASAHEDGTEKIDAEKDKIDSNKNATYSCLFIRSFPLPHRYQQPYDRRGGFGWLILDKLVQPLIPACPFPP